MLQHWLRVFLILFGLFNLLPFLAPVAAKVGLRPVADAIYTLYAPFCHQMAHRSFFMFGEHLMYSPQDLPIEITTDLTANTLAMRRFTGNEAIGWKVAWSDRMVYMYGAMWLSAAVYAFVVRRRRVGRLSIVWFGLLMLPMVVDGATHMVSDFSGGGLFGGFRYTNDWLADLTANTLPARFYIGDTLGSFNSLIRLISGIGFGIAAVGISFPLIDHEMQRTPPS